MVTAMTIHQSKGLQFPIVFLWGMGRHGHGSYDISIFI
ncbi:ATP-binding domain-containing protein [Erysipelothrix rhusiopathiae]|nr:ATP-binding domain-containing protein [Erysipelothrix rhusiopathiae]